MGFVRSEKVAAFFIALYQINQVESLDRLLACKCQNCVRDCNIGNCAVWNMRYGVCFWNSRTGLRLILVLTACVTVIISWGEHIELWCDTTTDMRIILFCSGSISGIITGSSLNHRIRTPYTCEAISPHNCQGASQLMIIRQLSNCTAIWQP